MRSSSDANRLIARMFDEAPDDDGDGDRTITSNYWGGDATTVAPPSSSPSLRRQLAAPSPPTSSRRRYPNPYDPSKRSRPSNAFVTDLSSKSSSPKVSGSQRRSNYDDNEHGEDDDDDVMGQRHPHVSELEILEDEESIADDLTDPTSGLPAIGCHRYDEERRDQFPVNNKEGRGPSSSGRPPSSSASRPAGIKPNATQQHSHIDPTETSFDENSSDAKQEESNGGAGTCCCVSKKQRRTKKYRCCLGICMCFTILLLVGVIALVVSIRNGNVQKLAESVSKGIGINGGGNSGGPGGGNGDTKPPKQNKNNNRRQLRIRQIQ
jgi:hypothetical protein